MRIAKSSSTAPVGPNIGTGNTTWQQRNKDSGARMFDEMVRVVQIQACKPILYFAGLAAGLISIVGCNSATDSSSAEPQSSNTISANAIGLTSNSTPTDVVDFVLAAIDQGDLASVRKVVAVDKVQKDIDQITRGKQTKQFKALRDNAQAAAATGILLNLSFLKDKTRKTIAETVQGDNAEVTVEGATIDGKSATKIVHLVKENGAWRLVPSQR